MADESENGLLQREVVVVNPQGLHLRPMTQIIKAVSSLDAEVTLDGPTGSANCAMITEMMMLFAPKGTRFTLNAKGPAAEAALEAVAALFAAGFHE